MTLLAFEGFFRLAGLAMDLAGRGPSGGARFTVLCEGDSFTYGIGGQDYPFQLEGVLNERAGKRLFRVVNKGVPGLSTALLADTLESHILESRPAVVIVLAGENNSWNSIRLRAGAARLPMAAAFESVLLRSRVYKFMKVLSIGWRHNTFFAAAGDLDQRTANHLTAYYPTADRPAEANESGAGDPPPARGVESEARALEYETRGEYPAALELYREVAALDPDRAGGHAGAGRCLMRLSRFEEAVAELKKAASARPSAGLEMAYYELGWALRRAGRSGEAIRAWRDGLGRFPRSSQLYQAMAWAHQEEGGLWEALEASRENPRIQENPLHRFLVRLSRDRGTADVKALISESFRSDVRRICATARLHGVPVVFVSYPDFAHPEVYETAAAEGARFVDFRPIFKRSFAKREEYISSDNCHCSSRGYRRMAEVLADEVQALVRP